MDNHNKDLMNRLFKKTVEVGDKRAKTLGLTRSLEKLGYTFTSEQELERFAESRVTEEEKDGQVVFWLDKGTPEERPFFIFKPGADEL